MVSPVTVRRGTILPQRGGSDGLLYLLKRGRVRLYRSDIDGRTLTLAVLGDGNVFGATDLVALGGADLYAEAMDECLICAMRQADVERLLREHPEVGLRLIGLLSQRVKELETLVASVAHEDVRHRLLRVLLRLTEDFGVPDGGMTRLSVPLSHEDLASVVGSTRETVTLTLTRLAHAGAVRTGRRELSVDSKLARALLGNGA